MTKSLKDWMTRVTNALDGILQTRVVTASSTTISANSYKNIAFTTALSGYSLIGVIAFDLKNVNLSPAAIVNNGTQFNVWVKNHSSSAVTVTPTITVLYCKSILRGGYRIRYYRQSSVKGVA